MNISLYLFFNGNCEEALNFYSEVFGSKPSSMQRYGDSPMPGSEDNKNKIMHATLPVAGGMLMMSDSDEKRNVSFGDNYSISLNFNSDGELNRTFDALSTGGQVTMPVQDTFWGATFGMCTDKFGVHWMFNYDKKK
jgi:PhnB protein